MNGIVERCRGASAALPTPHRMGRVDPQALEALCHRLIDRGVAALVPCGTTGESALLSPPEHHDVVAAAVAAAHERVPVIAGAGSNNTQTAIALAQSAEQAGADALLCVTPFYLKPTQAGLMLHFRAIHDAVGIPIILYDVPSRTACDERLEADIRWFDQVLQLLHAALFLKATRPRSSALYRLGLMGDGLRLPLTPRAA